MREYQPSTSNRHVPVLAVLEQVDAVILYAYAFYCEDQAVGMARNRQAIQAHNQSLSIPNDEQPHFGSLQWKMGCIADNWKSIFGLVSFVKSRAEKLAASPSPPGASHRIVSELPRAMELIVVWM